MRGSGELARRASGGGRRGGRGRRGFFGRRCSSSVRVGVVCAVEPPAARVDLRPASPRERRGGRGPELRGRLAERRRSSLGRGRGPDEAGAGQGRAGQLEGLAPPVRPRGVVGGAPGANPRRGRPRHERRGLREPLRPRAGRHLRGLGRTDRVRSMSIGGGGSALVRGLRRDRRARVAGGYRGGFKRGTRRGGTHREPGIVPPPARGSLRRHGFPHRRADAPPL